MTRAPRVPPASPTPTLRVAVAGATGFIGRALVVALRADGHHVRRLVRDARAQAAGDVLWDPSAGSLDPEMLRDLDAVVNLVGEPIAQRWTEDAKRRIRESRVAGTGLLARAMASLPHPPSVYISGSAIGYYGANRGEEILDESSRPGIDFLSSVSQEWEMAAAPAVGAGIRVAHPRTGVVLAPHGGALAKMLTPFRLGLGGKIGDGRQWLSWIALDDAIRALIFSLTSDRLRGPFNLVAPHPVRNETFVKTLADVLGRPALVPLPALAVRIALGEMGQATLLGSLRVAPTALEGAGFRFRRPELTSALTAG
ncbi:MAG: hypothetical protein NVS1B4_01150 [Gemmatimonadaceae bacterium]